MKVINEELSKEDLVRLYQSILAFTGLVLIDAGLTLYGLGTGFVVELNPFYHLIGDGFWVVKLLGTLTVIGLALTYKSLIGIKVCTGIMVAVVVWNTINLINITPFL